MKKGKIFRTLSVVGACMCAPLVLLGCDKEAESKVSFRVEDGYIQVTEDGTDWKNLVDIMVVWCIYKTRNKWHRWLWYVCEKYSWIKQKPTR